MIGVTLDANESERLWRMLGQLNEQVGQALDIASDTALRVERLERNIVAKSEAAGRKGARKGARWQATLVASAISLMAAVANYYAAKAPAQPANPVHNKVSP